MSSGLPSLLRLLSRDGAYVTAEDFDGAAGPLLRGALGAGFLGREPGVNPVPGCPHCGEGVPYRLGDRYLCNRCRGAVDGRHLLAWPLDRGAFCRWLAAALRLRGDILCLDGRLWQLGNLVTDGGPVECFYLPGGEPTDFGQARLLAYRDVLLLYGLSTPPKDEWRRVRCVSLLELLRFDGVLTVADPYSLLRARDNVRFVAGSGALWVGEAWLGEVPVGSKEFFFLDCLARHLDSFVPYADLKHFVLRQSGSRDGTEEATFCQNLKSRIKKKWVPRIGRLLATTNKGDGYRLRGFAEAS
jgi:hypothetical protein